MQTMAPASLPLAKGLHACRAVAGRLRFRRVWRGHGGVPRVSLMLVPRSRLPVRGSWLRSTTRVATTLLGSRSRALGAVDLDRVGDGFGAQVLREVESPRAADHGSSRKRSGRVVNALAAEDRQSRLSRPSAG